MTVFEDKIQLLFILETGEELNNEGMVDVN
jgi:hypothetical protein